MPLWRYAFLTLKEVEEGVAPLPLIALRQLPDYHIIIAKLFEGLDDCLFPSG